jgi:hypothetical protein
MTDLKSTSAIREQVEKGYTCRAPGCTEHRTIYKGEGAEYCRGHQVKLMEGLARADRPYTLHKKWCCDWCEYNPKEDKRFGRMTDPIQKDRAQRATLICDHIVRRADARAMGWTDDQIDDVSNIQTLCQICDKIKSSEEDDWSKLAGVNQNDFDKINN